MRVENNNLNELGLSKGEMCFWLITLVLCGIILAVMAIDTHITFKELDAMKEAVRMNP